ncbi:hypothetical protein FMO003_25930 [Moritella sp. F3]|nr:hypothetical protein FMO001_19200 [Moritella sp. F1]GIC82312.1 hypothetical protein FMO003_25930 [Moritella sp. F3]
MKKPYSEKLYDCDLYFKNAVWIMYLALSYMGYSKWLIVPIIDELIVFTFNISTYINWWVTFVFSVGVLWVISSLLVDSLVKRHTRKGLKL